MKAILDEAGRIQLPDDLRTQLGIKPGDEVILEAHAGEWVLKSARVMTGLDWEGNVLVHKGTTLTGTTIDNLLEETRSERFHQLSEGFCP
jgi:AbrB family looped-hinge helix DNA binding protein